MSLILRQVIGYQQGRSSVPLGTTDPAIKKKLEDSQKQLNSILKKWSWDGVNPATAQEFLNKFTPWVEEHIKQGKDLKVFLSKWGSTSLNQLETTWKDTEENYKEQIRELQSKGTAELSEELKEKLENYENLESENQRLNRLLNDEESELEKENQQLLKKIEDLKETYELSEEDQEKLNNYDNLETDLDQAKRDKYEAEQELLATNNRLKNKVKELDEKQKEIDRVKKEAQEKEKSLNDKIAEWKKKYQAKVKQLDIEQTEANKLEGEIEKLNQKIASLETERIELLKNQKDI